MIGYFGEYPGTESWMSPIDVWLDLHDNVIELFSRQHLDPYKNGEFYDGMYLRLPRTILVRGDFSNTSSLNVAGKSSISLPGAIVIEGSFHTKELVADPNAEGTFFKVSIPLGETVLRCPITQEQKDILAKEADGNPSVLTSSMKLTNNLIRQLPDYR